MEITGEVFVVDMSEKFGNGSVVPDVFVEVVVVFFGGPTVINWSVAVAVEDTFVVVVGAIVVGVLIVFKETDVVFVGAVIGSAVVGAPVVKASVVAVVVLAAVGAVVI